MQSPSRSGADAVAEKLHGVETIFLWNSKCNWIFWHFNRLEFELAANKLVTNQKHLNFLLLIKVDAVFTQKTI